MSEKNQSQKKDFKQKRKFAGDVLLSSSELVEKQLLSSSELERVKKEEKQ